MVSDHHGVKLQVRYRKYVEIARNVEIVHHNSKQFINKRKNGSSTHKIFE